MGPSPPAPQPPSLRAPYQRDVELLISLLWRQNWDKRPPFRLIPTQGQWVSEAGGGGQGVSKGAAYSALVCMWIVSRLTPPPLSTPDEESEGPGSLLSCNS